MKADIRTVEGYEKYKLRMQSIEPVFGNIKYNKGFKYYRLRGLQGAKIEFLLIMIAHNLGKMHKLGL